MKPFLFSAIFTSMAMGGMGGGAFGDHGLTGVGSGMKGSVNVPVAAADPVDTLRTLSVIWIEGINIDGSSNSTLTDEDAIETVHNPGTLGDLTQAASAQRPIFDTGILNSNPVLRFDGTDDNVPLNTTSDLNFIWGDGDFEIAAVAMMTSTSVNRPIIGTGTSGSEVGFLLQFHATNVVRFFSMNGTTTIVNRSTGSVSPSVWYAVGARGDGVNAGPSVDLTTYNEAVQGTFTANPASDTVALYQDGATGSLESAGSLAFLAVFDRELTSDERSTLRTYVNDTWGFSL